MDLNLISTQFETFVQEARNPSDEGEYLVHFLVLLNTCSNRERDFDWYAVLMMIC